jgi:AmmeMemoRadiSam system protein A
MVLMRIVDPGAQALLLALARQSIAEGMSLGTPLQLESGAYSTQLQRCCGNFVTLKLSGALRGCIGSLEADKPLVQGIADNAFNAAFRDPRFDALSLSELESVALEISLLSTPEAMIFTSEREALSQLHAGIDGLILSVGSRRATFLPSVWRQLPDASLLLNELKLKAGLPQDYWSDQLRLQRYRSHSFSDTEAAASNGGSRV